LTTTDPEGQGWARPWACPQGGDGR